MFDDPFGHMGWKPSRGDGVDLDIVRRPLAGEIFSEGDDATFAGVIADGLEFGGGSSQTRDGRDVDDLAGALRDHGFACRLTEEEGAGQVGRENSVPLVEGHVFDGSSPGDARVVDEDVEAAELGESFIDHELNR